MILAIQRWRQEDQVFKVKLDLHGFLPTTVQMILALDKNSPPWTLLEQHITFCWFTHREIQAGVNYGKCLIKFGGGVEGEGIRIEKEMKECIQSWKFNRWQRGWLPTLLVFKVYFTVNLYMCISVGIYTWVHLPVEARGGCLIPPVGDMDAESQTCVFFKTRKHAWPLSHFSSPLRASPDKALLPSCTGLSSIAPFSLGFWPHHSAQDHHGFSLPRYKLF